MSKSKETDDLSEMQQKLSEMQQRYETGMEIFKQLFALDSEQLRKKIVEICGSAISNSYIEVILKGRIRKVIYNDEPETITFEYYDCVTIDVFGISIKPEHGGEQKIVRFDKFFKLV